MSSEHVDAVESKLDRVIDLLEQVLDPWCECGHRQTAHTDDHGVCAQWVEQRRCCVCVMFRKIVKL